jgi:hypothetical protein
MELSHGKDAEHDEQSHYHKLRDEKGRLRLCWGHRFQRRYFLEQLGYQYEHVQIQADHNIDCVGPAPRTHEMTEVARP